MKNADGVTGAKTGNDRVQQEHTHTCHHPDDNVQKHRTPMKELDPKLAAPELLQLTNLCAEINSGRRHGNTDRAVVSVGEQAIF